MQPLKAGPASIIPSLRCKRASHCFNVPLVTHTPWAWAAFRCTCAHQDQRWPSGEASRPPLLITHTHPAGPRRNSGARPHLRTTSGGRAVRHHAPPLLTHTPCSFQLRPLGWGGGGRGKGRTAIKCAGEQWVFANSCQLAPGPACPVMRPSSSGYGWPSPPRIISFAEFPFQRSPTPRGILPPAQVCAPYPPPYALGRGLMEPLVRPQH